MSEATTTVTDNEQIEEFRDPPEAATETASASATETAPVAPKELEGKTPWFVMRVTEGGANGKPISGEAVSDETFRFQTDADKWIKENCTEGDVFASLRRGSVLKVDVVRKVIEV